MYTIYHNPRCRKSREALHYLKKHSKQVEVINYFNEPISKFNLKEILDKIKHKPSQVLRKNEADWKAVADKNLLTEDDILDILVKYPKTLERPIVISEDSGVIARPIENLILFLNSNQTRSILISKKNLN